MVKVVKNGMTLTIPAGAVKTYCSAGWKLAPSDEGKARPVKSQEKPMMKSEDTEETYDEEEEVEYVDPEDLAQKPLEELDIEELKILAEYKGLDTTRLTSARKLRTALESLE